MKKISLMFLMGVILILAACTSENKDSLVNIKLSDSENENVEAAKADLSQSEFNDAIEEANKETAKENNAEVVDLFEGATYEAYLLTRAKLTQESFDKAKEQDVFATEVSYEDYQSVAEAFVNDDEYQGSYGAYAAKSVQYLTPKGIPN
ncbi:hypothetical protein [Sporosarcina sp. P7]|uniref:hypothetical protein n=1 Tax=Sporosarcina sp. P7 TaxID=2048244 RepID=UPI000C168609|nr:hypothetical protein [Sporosarcina sp. P7]PID25416.1 hypothetical protein CSV60_04965 [Sporosarcina sp. P7]